MTSLPVDYGPLAHELLRRASASRQPANGVIELTSRCNLACGMCYVRNAAGNAAVREKELPASTWLSLIRDAKANGLVFLLLTGGEVFLRPDLFEILEPLTQMGLVLALFTNGTLITDAVAERLAQAPPHRTEVTLYGATAATYEAITGVPGSFARCCSGIQALVERRIPLSLKTTVTRQNVGELAAMRAMAHNWGVPFTAGWMLTKRRDGEPSDVEECRLTAAECVALEAGDEVSARGWAEVAQYETPADDKRNFFCQAGRTGFSVNAAGEMNACLDLNLPAAKPLENGFLAAWGALQRFVDEDMPMVQECVECGARDYCPRCPAWSHLETGTLNGPVSYLCEIARARKARYVQRA